MQDRPSRVRNAVTSLLRQLHPRAAGGQASILASGRVLAGLTSAVWLVVAAHQLGTTEFGDLTLMLSLASVCNVMGDLGIGLALGVHVAKHRGLARPVLHLVLRRRFERSLAAAAIAGVFYVAVASPHTWYVPVIFAVSIIGKSIHTTQSVALRSLNRTHVEALNDLCSRLGVLAVGAFWLLHGGGLLAAVSVYAVADLLSALIVSGVTRRHVSDELHEVPLDELRIRRSFAYAVGSIASTIYASVDIWILAALHGTDVSGHYAAANKILDASLMPAAAVAFLGPARMPQLPRSRQAHFAKVLGGVAVLTVLPALAITLPFSSQLMGLLFGSAYRSSGFLLVLLMVSAPAAAFISAVSVPVILHSQRVFLRAIVICLVLNIALNAALIPHWSGSGAAVANLAGDSVLAGLLGWTVWRHVGRGAPGPAGAADGVEPAP